MVCLTTFGFSANDVAAQDRCFRIIDLGEIGPLAAASGPFGVNYDGTAVFTKEVGDYRHAFVTVPPPAIGPIGNGCFDLHILSGMDEDEESVAHDINNSDIAVGWATFGDEKHAVVWRIDLYDPLQPDPIPFVDLGLLNLDPGGSTYSEAFAINDDSPPVIVGQGDVIENCTCGGTGSLRVPRGFWRTLLDPPDFLDSAVRLIHTGIDCYPTTSASDVNTGPGGEEHLTTAVGYGIEELAPCNGDQHIKGHYWNNPVTGQGVRLQGSSNNGWNARGISDQGAIVGSIFYPTSAAYWNDVNVLNPLDIGSLSILHNSPIAQRINNIDPATGTLAVAGWHKNNEPREEAVLWECAGDCTVLNNWGAEILEEELIPDCSGWQIRRADDVNDGVSIICWATNTADFPSTQHAVLLEPLEGCCPEDLDRDGDVDFDDLNIVLANMGSCFECSPCIADLDCNGVVDAYDQRIVTKQILSTSPCGGGLGGASAAQQAASMLGFASAEALADWVVEVSMPEAVTAGFVFSSIGQDILDQ